MLTQQKFKATFKGITALVFNNPEFMLLQRPSDKTPLEWEREKYREKLHRNAEKQVVLPGVEIRKRLRQACQHVELPKEPGESAVRFWGPIIEASLMVPDDLVLEVDYAKIICWTAIVSLDPGKGRKSPKGPRARPLVPLPWQGTCDLVSLDSRLTEKKLGLLFETTGAKIGFGDALVLGYGRAEIEIKAV